MLRQLLLRKVNCHLCVFQDSYRVIGVCNSICQRLPHWDALCVCLCLCVREFLCAHPRVRTAGLPPVPSAITIPRPISIVLFLNKTLPLSPSLLFLRFYLCPFLSPIAPLGLPLYHHSLSYLSRSLSLYLLSLSFPAAHFTPVWDCCSVPSSPQLVIP